MAKSKVPAAKTAAKTPTSKSPVKMFFSKLIPKFGPFEIFGSENVPPGAIRIDVADIYPVYVIKFLFFQIALDIGRDK